MNNIKSSQEICEYVDGVGLAKATNAPKKTRILAFLAGMFIAIGAIASTRVNLLMSGNPHAAVISSFTFCIGIVLVLVAGAELFTGNILLTVACLNKTITLKQTAINWIRVWVWNFLGAIFFGVLTYYTLRGNAEYGEYFRKLVETKTSYSFTEAIIEGFLCNVLVSLSVWMSYGSHNAIGKVALSVFAVFIFVLLKYEHVVANMFYFTYGYLAGSDVPVLTSILKSFLPVTIGNILGGAFIAGMYQFAYKK